jgi:UDP-GlcNAc3NAcA epimerase
MKIVTIIGARPQFIKASALSRAVSSRPDIEEVIVHTGQHFDPNMSDIFFDEMEIPSPKYHLEIHSLGHGAMTGRMLEGIENILKVENPDYVLVYGDTNSTLAGALAAKKLHIKLVHVEAGLRSFNMAMPEEINRILTDRISDILFCPTQNAINNLVQEGFEHFGTQIYNCGDIMYDAALFYKEKANQKSNILSNLKIIPENFVLATIHRQENTDDLERLRNIVEALNYIHQTHKVIVPLHPRTKKILDSSQIKVDFMVIEPIGYMDMIALTSNAYMVLTDSGGLQKEAFFFGKYCITLRDQTEWIELVESGFNTLAGADKSKIIACFENADSANLNFNVNLYGEGQTASFILDHLKI